LALLHAAALALFTDGFLLRRTKLPDRSQSPVAGGGAYDKLVWIVVDALRYDFVASDGRYAQACSARGALCHQGRMPHLQSLIASNVSLLAAGARSRLWGASPDCAHGAHRATRAAAARASQPGAARAFRFVAEAPTTTVQRIAAMTAGSLPTFFDISSSFTTAPLAEDNLVEQLKAHGRKLVRPACCRSNLPACGTARRDSHRVAPD
jgi:phosphatidylinositol glycan class O